MKKNYVKPSLLSETFVTENIMSGGTSAASLWSLTGADTYESEGLIKFNSTGGNTLFRINFTDFNK